MSHLDDGIDAIETKLREEMEGEFEDVHTYAEHLRAGGGRDSPLKYGSRARRWEGRLNNEHRRDLGLRAIPASPSDHNYGLLVHLIDHLGEWFSYADLKRVMRGGGNVQDRLGRHLRETPYALERSTDNGPVAYRIVEVPA